MTKEELITEVATRAGITKAGAQKAVQAFVDTVSNALIEGDKVQLIGFGTFEVRERAAREGRNPATGETMHIAASKAPAFKPGKAFKEAVNR